MTTVTVQSTGATGTVPSATDNDFTRIDNAIHAAVNGSVIRLAGTFNFGETNAAASGL